METKEQTKEQYADAKTIHGWIATLAQSQGSYGRLLEYYDSHPIMYETLAEQKFKTMLDMVLFIEGGY